MSPPLRREARLTSQLNAAFRIGILPAHSENNCQLELLTKSRGLGSISQLKIDFFGVPEAPDTVPYLY